MKTVFFNTFILLLFFHLSYSQNLHDYVTVFESIPGNDKEHVNIFGDEPNINDKKIYEEGYLEYISGESRKGKGLADLKQLIVKHKTKSSFNSCFIIIGHNQEGILKFANGESIAITELEKLLGGIRTIFLSCNSNNYLSNNKNIGVNYPIKICEAITISNKINKHLYNNKCNNALLPNSSINKSIIKIINEHKFNKSTTKALKITGSVIFTGGIIYVYNKYGKKDEASEPQNSNIGN